jgi:hypothetical protein
MLLTAIEKRAAMGAKDGNEPCGNACGDLLNIAMLVVTSRCGDLTKTGADECY